MNSRESGRIFEDIACAHLIEKGFSLQVRNFHAGKIGEIDIVATKNGELYFIEVKGRNSLNFGSPAESISQKKKQKMRLSAQYYVKSQKMKEVYMNFVIVEVLKENSSYKINLIEEVY